jgi:hypothetical protein
MTNNPSESFNFNVNGVIYKFKQKWNTLGFWTLDILDIEGNPFVYGIKIVTKENLLIMHPSIPFELRSEKEDDPTRNNLSEFELEILEKSNV